ncbi:MAG: pyrimidine reductase [Clostridia bacterium]
MNKFTLLDFPVEKIQFKTLMRNEAEIAAIKATSPEPPTPSKILEAYGEVQFPPAPTERPYTFASIVVSSDGKIAFPDDGHGELIAGNNFRDPDGALGDFWVLNMLRFYADGIIIGARTLNTNELMWANCFDGELADLRLSEFKKKHYCPAHIVVSFDGTDIPFGHMIFDIDAPLLFATSPIGLNYIQENSGKNMLTIGPYKNEAEINLAEIKGLLETKPQQRVVIATGEGKEPDGKLLLYILKNLGLERILVESPSYMTYLMSIESMDEMFMNYSSVFAAGKVGFGAFLEFSVNDHPHSDFIQVGMHKANFIATRQKMIYGLKNPNKVNIHTGKPI